MSASVGLLKDDFADDLIATAWVASASGSATVAETSGQARFTLPSSTAGTHVARYTSRVTYDLTGANFYINIGTMVATGVAATAFFQLYLNGANTLQWIQLSGTIYARKVVAGVSTDLFSAAWSGSTYKYLRIRESAGSVFWESSSTGTSWTTRATLVGLPFAITDLFIDFGATCGNVASPGSFRLDDVNLLLPALITAWNWTQVVWPFDERTETITAAIDVIGTVMGYVVTADGVDASDAPSGNVRYWAGPMDAGRILTEQPTQAAAQAMAVYFPLDGRMDLETMVEGHCYRIYHRSVDGNSYILRELFPRRTIYADDIKAESIQAIHIRAGSITADRLDVTELSAITANAGTLTAGVIDGVTVYAGARAVILNAIGLAINNTTTAIDPFAQLRLTSNGADRGYLAQYEDTNDNKVVLSSGGVSGKRSVVALETGPFASNKDAWAYISAQYITAIAAVTAKYLGATGTTQIEIRGDSSVVTGVMGIRGFPLAPTTVALGVKGLGTTNTTAAISATNSGGLINFQALDDGTIRTRNGARWDIGTYVGGGTLTATGLTAVTINGTARFFLTR